MMEDSYLVPANAKKGTLIFNLFRPFDIGLFAIGVAVTLIMLLAFSDKGMLMLIISIMPAGITGLLVFPVPNYHNVLCAIQSMIAFFSGNREYQWKGWCFYEQFINDEKSKK